MNISIKLFYKEEILPHSDIKISVVKLTTFRIEYLSKVLAELTVLLPSITLFFKPIFLK